MKKWTGRRLRKQVSRFLWILSLLILGITAALTADKLLAMLTPQSLLRFAMPMLSGIDVPETYTKYHTDESEYEDESDDDYDANEIRFEVMDPDKGVSDKIRIELMGTSRNEKIDLSGEEPRVLIYHTHTTEAYMSSDKYPYVAKNNDFRTDMEDKNIVAVGAKLAKILREEYGISVIHDTTNHEPPSLRTSYSRSLVTMEENLEKYPSIDLFIDVHRDAYELKDGETNSDYVTINGERVARLMFVVGTGEGKTGAGFSVKPNYKENYALALSVSENLKEAHANIARPIRVKTSRYNQHIPGRSLLVEVGHNANTLDEALAAIPYLAKAIAQSAGVGDNK